MMLGAVLLLFLVLGVLIFVIWKYFFQAKEFSVRENQKKEQQVYISKKGVNLDSGSLGGGSGELFAGNGNDSMDTFVISGNRNHNRDCEETGYSVKLQNLNGGQIYEGNFYHEIILGRGNCQNGENLGIRFPYASVSRKHCRFFIEGSRVYVEDLGSSNGTYLNEKQVVKPKLLIRGDILKIGHEKFRVEI
ncbi:MAG: FHA domain-containing protein [Blautia sp.]